MWRMRTRPGAKQASIGLLLAALGALPAAARAADPGPGEKQFLASCGVCHTAEKGGEARQGPNLFGVYGRKAGTLPGFKYSAALKDGGWVWDETTLDPWITNAQAAHPGTVMNYRQANPEKRKLVIEYLKSLSGGN
jgi:cytochrome c